MKRQITKENIIEYSNMTITSDKIKQIQDNPEYIKKLLDLVKDISSDQINIEMGANDMLAKQMHTISKLEKTIEEQKHTIITKEKEISEKNNEISSIKNFMSKINGFYKESKLAIDVLTDFYKTVNPYLELKLLEDRARQVETRLNRDINRKYADSKGQTIHRWISAISIKLENMNKDIKNDKQNPGEQSSHDTINLSIEITSIDANVDSLDVRV
jgi:lysophospholipase L1-like esterase